METLRPASAIDLRGEQRDGQIDRVEVLHFFEKQGYRNIFIDKRLLGVKVELERKLQEGRRYPRFHVIVSLQPLGVGFHWDEYRHHTPLSPSSWELTENEIARILQSSSKDFNSPAAETLRRMLRSIQYFGLAQIIHHLEEKRGEHFHQGLIKVKRSRTGKRSSRVKMAQFKARKERIEQGGTVDDWGPIEV